MTTKLIEIFEARTRAAAAQIEMIRAATDHPGEKGSAFEDVIIEILEDFLPEKIGITKGFVIDCTGSISKQLDVILYDKQGTPKFFSGKGFSLVPVECTYAAGEIKSELKSDTLLDCFDKATSYKSLQRMALVPDHSPYIDSFDLFGENFAVWQSIFFVIALNSISSDKLTNEFVEKVRSDQILHTKRIDTICALSGEMIINNRLPSGSDQAAENSLSFLPTSLSNATGYRSERPLALFLFLLMRILVMAPQSRVDLVKYAGDGPL